MTYTIKINIISYYIQHEYKYINLNITAIATILGMDVIIISGRDLNEYHNNYARYTSASPCIIAISPPYYGNCGGFPPDPPLRIETEHPKYHFNSQTRYPYTRITLSGKCHPLFLSG
ncbi:hypothetical protein [Methanocalculus chunghsingensis]|uniref:hypothetical protein n=1 Tax=Methanocalculus chunghsingensis TaxID=156457 RepID=UPI001FE60BC7|nr:hypothetical protein [Methanocalculus chunghsingensis]